MSALTAYCGFVCNSFCLTVPPQAAASVAEPAASLSSWTTLPSNTGHDRDALSVRTATFATPTIIFGADVGKQQLLQLCRSTPVQLQVHDRTALPEAAPFTAARMQRQKQLQQQQQQRPPSEGKAGARGSAAKQAAAVKGSAAPSALKAPAAQPAVAASAASKAAASADSPVEPPVVAAVVSDDGEVYASASVSMADLVKRRTGCRFSLPLQPVSTIRGGSCSDWKSRPGRYLEVRMAGAAARSMQLDSVHEARRSAAAVPSPAPPYACLSAGAAQEGQTSLTVLPLCVSCCRPMQRSRDGCAVQPPCISCTPAWQTHWLQRQQPLLQRSSQWQQLPNLLPPHHQPAAAVQLPNQLLQEREPNKQLQHSQQREGQHLVQAQQQQLQQVLPCPLRVLVKVAVKQDRVRPLQTSSQTSCHSQLRM